MGFRCPNCKTDFKHDKKLFHQHLKDNEECRRDALERLGEELWRYFKD